MRTIPNKLLAIATIALLAVSCDTGEKDKVVSLDMSLLSFLSEDTPKTVKVFCADPWTASSQDNWITVTPGDGQFTVAVTENTATNERSGSVIVKASGYQSATLTVTQSGRPAEAGEASYRVLSEMYPYGVVISPSGRYCAGFVSFVNEHSEVFYRPVITDLKENIVYNMDPFPETLYMFSYADSVTDEGVAYYGIGYAKTLQVTLENQATLMTPPADAAQYLSISDTSVDGSLVIGTTMKQDDVAEGTKYMPIIYKNGLVEYLPILQTSYRDTPSWGGVIARGCSRDGSIIFGTDWENLEGGMCYWRADENYSKFHWVGEECGHRTVRKAQLLDDDGTYYDTNLVDGVQGFGSVRYLSPDGKWLAGEYRSEVVSDDERDVVVTIRPYFFNTEERLGHIAEYPGMIPTAITDDGIAFITPNQTQDRTIVVDARTGDKIGDLSDWCMTTYGINAPEGWVAYCAPNGILFGGTNVATALGVYEQYWIITPGK